MEINKKYRKTSASTDELKDAMDELKLRKVPVTLWQSTKDGSKNIKGAIITSCSKPKNEVTFSSIDNIAFDFVQDSALYFFANIKGIFCKTILQFCSAHHLAIPFPQLENIRMAEFRNQSRLRADKKIIHVVVRKEKTAHVFEMMDISELGLGLKVNLAHRWNFNMHDSVTILQIGKRVVEPALEATVAHISNAPVAKGKKPNTFMILGLQLKTPFNSDQYYHYMEELF